MARDPGSVWKPIPEASSQGSYTKDKFIVHSTGSNGTAAGTWNYFAGPTENESTFIVGTGPSDPTLQLLDSSARADANIAANQSGISVEVVGDGVGGYSSWQQSEIVRLGVWSRQNHPIAAQIVPYATGSGLGWHIMFGAPGPWTSVAKICPGPKRIAELKATIFPAIIAGTLIGDDMPLSQDDLNKISVVVYTWSQNALATNLIDWGDRKTSVIQQLADNAKAIAELKALVGQGGASTADLTAIAAGLAIKPV